MGKVRVGLVGGVATLPEYRGMGLAGNLLELILEHMRSDRCDIAVLWATGPRLRAEYLRDFMRETRKIADQVSESRGRRLRITAMTSGTFTQDLYHGWDTKTWVEEKLVDEMVAALIHTQYLHAKGIKEFCYVGPNGPDSYVRAAINRAESGADGFLIWDLDSVQEFSNHWLIVRELGHTEKILASLGNLPGIKKIRLKKAGNIDVEHTYDWGGTQALVFYTNG